MSGRARERKREETESDEMAMVNLKLLACSMCFNLLHPPLFKCTKGHVVCKSCNDRLTNRCHDCFRTNIFFRNIPLKEILQSARVFCPNKKFGCNALIPHDKKHKHQKTCSFPCSCPEESCEFSSSAREMKGHLISTHGCSVHHFRYGTKFEVSLSDPPKYKILAADQDGCIFILKPRMDQILGMTLSLFCIRPTGTGTGKDESEFWYDLMVYEESMGRRIIFFSASISGSTLGRCVEDIKTFALLSDSEEHLLSSGNLMLSICIKTVYQPLLDWSPLPHN